MAININTVYKSVLSILNKEQRGFLTPDEFNKIAREAQMNLLDIAFIDYNKMSNLDTVGRNKLGYDDILSKVTEQIDIYYKKYTIMAINVDTVYKTVLLILNQQQRGYMTPDEFNKVGTQVQLNIFEKYEDDLNQQYRMPQNDTEYANRIKNIEENLSFFQRTGATAYVGPHFTLTPNDIYRLGSVFYNGTELTQYAQRNELTQLLLSPLTQPTTSFPIYLYENNLLYVYPTSIINSVTISYLKKPADVEWKYSVGSLGQFVYNAGTSINFELSVSEQTNVITRILAYAGVIINDPTIIQVAQQEIQLEEQNSKQ